MKILIVDDNETNLKVLNLILAKAEYDIHTTHSPESVIDRLEIFFPDLILLDINMPKISGYDLCKEIKSIDKFKDIPIIFISALTDSEDIVKGFKMGAVDYVIKPFKSEEIKARVSTHLEIKKLQEELRNQNAALEQRVKEQVEKITQTQMETIFSLAKLAQSRDDDTGQHLERVQNYCWHLAAELKKSSIYCEQVSDDFINNIKQASPLHDIGKVGISDTILLKPGKLTDEEFVIMKTHTILGYDTLKEVNDKFGQNAFIEMGMVIARSHHERYDGFGYPDKLSGNDIPLAARIMAIADVYDALRAKRVYKDAFSHEKSVSIILEGRGTQFDPVLVDAFERIAHKFDEIAVSLANVSLVN